MLKKLFSPDKGSSFASVFINGLIGSQDVIDQLASSYAFLDSKCLGRRTECNSFPHIYYLNYERG